MPSVSAVVAIVLGLVCLGVAFLAGYVVGLLSTKREAAEDANALIQLREDNQRLDNSASRLNDVIQKTPKP